jgi:predicted ATPase/DNA-binding CsgD family transcriptional regulator
MGPAINRCARIRALAKGGQVVLSEATRALVLDDLPRGATLLAAGRHRLRDLDRREHLFLLRHPDLGEVSPRLRDDSEINLPTIPTTFVARDEELAALTNHLDATPLVTLTGAGGAGKTRLALEYAHRNAARFDDGVAWADASTIADGDLLADRVASALEIREAPTERLVDTMAREVAGRHLLLVLDNCEHVTAAAADLIARLVGAAPRLRVLATSREPLGVTGERAVRVASLEIEAATRLFADRARTLVADFEVSAENEAAVVEICRRLDGIPLAIELAAARMNLLTPRQIADGLTDRFGLLTGGSRTALPRQRTLEASVDWSYRLLADGERVLLDRLSVFAGAFTLDAVRQVCTIGDVDAASVLRLLAALVDKSLVQVDTSDGERDRRYRLLETIRHFGRQHLVDDPDAAAIRDRHLDCFLDLAERTAAAIEAGEQTDTAAWAALDADLDNLRAAREWAHQRNDGRLLRLVAALWMFHEVRCHFEEAVTWLRTALAAAPEPTAARAEALRGLGDIAAITNDLGTSVACGEEVVAIGEQLGDPVTTARGLTVLGWVASFGVGHDPRWGVDVLNEVVAGLEPGVHPWLEADALTGLSACASTAGDVARAIAAARQAIASAERSGLAGLLQRAHCYLGIALANGGYAAASAEESQISIDLGDDLGETFFSTGSLTSLSLVRCWQGRLDESIALAREAIDISHRTANAYCVALATLSLAQTHVARGDDAAARSLVEECRAFVDALDVWSVTTLADGAVALADARERPDEARARLAATERRLGARERWMLALFRGWVERIAGDDAAAESAFTAALEGSVRGGFAGDALAALHELGVCACRRGQAERGVRLFAAAESLRSTQGIEPRPRPPSLASRTDDHNEARAVLGTDGFAAAWAAGSTLSLEEAARFALRGKGGRRRPTSGWESLTATELEVVRLVREGLSNPAIAERMFISKGTVKVHLSHVFTKLGMTSRAELAAAAAQRAVMD